MVDTAVLRGRLAAVTAGVGALAVVAVVPLGVQSVLVRGAFVALWVLLPWFATRGIVHVVTRAGTGEEGVRAASALAFIGASAVCGGLTPRLVGGEVDVRWAVVGGVVGALLLLAAARLPFLRVPRDDDDETWRRGPFL